VIKTVYFMEVISCVCGTFTYYTLHGFHTFFAGWSPAWSGGKVRGSLCFCGDNGRRCSWIELHRWRSSSGSVHGSLLRDADQVRARTLQTLKRSHALPSTGWVSVQKSYSFFLRLRWWPSFSLYIYAIFWNYCSYLIPWSIKFGEKIGYTPSVSKYCSPVRIGTYQKIYINYRDKTLIPIENFLKTSESVLK